MTEKLSSWLLCLDFQCCETQLLPSRQSSVQRPISRHVFRKLKLTPHHCRRHHYISITQDVSSAPAPCQLLFSLSLFQSSSSIHVSRQAAGLTWCLSAEAAGCLGGAGMSRPPKHPETKVGCEPGCSEEAALG